jgi:hypothetical protein
MEASFFLMQEILSSIEIYCTEMPTIVKNKYINSISLFWELKEDQNSMYEMFSSIGDRNVYFKYLQTVFEKEYPRYRLKVTYEQSLVNFNDKLATSIHLEWNILP